MRATCRAVNGWRLHVGSAVLALGSLVASLLVSFDGVFAKYPNLARALELGIATPDQVGDVSPAYLLLHLLGSPLLVRWLQACAAALTVVLIFRVLHQQSGPLAGWLGAGTLAASQQWAVYSAVMEPDLLIGASVTTSIVFLRREALTTGRSAMAGLALGCAVSLRPTVLLFAVLVFVWLVATKASLRVIAPWAAALVLASAAPSLMLRSRVGHDLRGTMSAGQVFHQSHRPESVGFGATFPSLLKVVEAQAAASGPHPPDHAHELYRELARVSDPAVANALDAETFWFSRTVAFFRVEPVAATLQLLQKVVFFLAPPTGEYDIPAVKPLLRQSVGIPLRWLTLLAGGSLAVLLLSRKSGGVGLWGLHWLAALVVALLFYFHGRYAVGLVPTLAALIGLGAARAWSERHRRWLLLMLMAPLPLLSLRSVRWADRMVERLNALELSEGGTWEAARERYVQEQAAVPDVFWPTSPRGVGLGVDDPALARRAAAEAFKRYGVDSPVDATLAAALLAAAGDCAGALTLANTATGSGFSWALGDRSIDPQLVASDCLVRLGRPEEALARLEASNREHPGRLDTLARLVAAGDVGHPSEIERWEAELQGLHDAGSVRFALASARRRWGDPQGALADAQWLKERWPAAAPFAEHERSLCLVALQRPEAALDAWTKALTVRAGLHEQALLDPLVTALEANAAGNEQVAALTITHWRKQGRRVRVQALLKAFPNLKAP